jgi:hypothetical protein
MSHKQRIAAFFAALPTGKVPPELVTDDMVAWTPTSGETSRPRFAGGISALASLFAGDFSYRVESLIEEGDLAAAEVRSTGTFLDGEPYEQTHMFAFAFRGERIARVAEHMNTAITMEKIVPRMQALMAKS